MTGSIKLLVFTSLLHHCLLPGSMSVFSDSFTVAAIDPEGKRFDRVSRALCESSTNSKTHLTLDYHNQLFALKIKDQFSVNIYLEEECDSSKLSNIDYAMNGMIFKIEQNGENINTFISFGGLLALIKSDLAKQASSSSGKKVTATFKRIT